MTIEGANNGGLLSRLNGLSLFVPVSQLEKKGHNEWWTEQARPDRARHALNERGFGAGSHCAVLAHFTCRTWLPSLPGRRSILRFWR